MIVYTDSRNRAEPKGETLRTFKTCYEYNKDFGRKKTKQKKPKPLQTSFARSTVQAATEHVDMLGIKRG